jgi:hypothetical protein
VARAVARYVVAALLALLYTQTAVPCVRLQSAAEIIWCSESERQTSPERVTRRVYERRELGQVAYESRMLPPPDSAVLFQRPPPLSSFFS